MVGNGYREISPILPAVYEEPQSQRSGRRSQDLSPFTRNTRLHELVYEERQAQQSGFITRNTRFSMPKVVPDQFEKFENDDLFRKLSRESEIRYTGHRDRPHEERQVRFQAECREGHADIAFVASGMNLQLSFLSNAWSDRPEDRTPTREFVDFDREVGKVHLKSQFILNGVCVIWRGWVDLQRLDGTGCLEFDEDRARVEDTLLREQIEAYNRRLREFEDRQRAYREEQERQAEAEAEVVKALLRFSENDNDNPNGGAASSSKP